MEENILHIGLCLPKSCNNDQVQHLMQELLDSYESDPLFGRKPKVLEVKHPSFHPQFFLKKSVISLGTCIIVAAFLSRWAINLKKQAESEVNTLETKNQTELSLHKFIKCFNYEVNKSVIVSREVSKSSINSISGMR